MRAALLVLVVGCSFQSQGALDSGGPLDAPKLVDGKLLVDAPHSLDAPAIDALVPPAGWWDVHWLRRHEIELDNTAITSELDRFPVLVVLTPTTFDYSTASAVGSDLRFVSNDGSNTVFDYDIDTFTPGGTSVLWVLVPKILATPAAHTTFWLYSDNPTASASESPAMVWSDYVSVQHLIDGTDSTTHGHDSIPAAANAMAPSSVAGLLGSGMSFNGTNQALSLAKPNDFNLPSMTVGMWIKTAPFTQTFQCLVCKGDGVWRLQRQGTGRIVDFGTTDTGPNDVDGTTTVDDNNWHYVVGTFDAGAGPKKIVYTDGNLEGSNQPGQMATNATAVEIGNNSQQGNRYYAGIADEFRVTAQVRSSVWIKTEYTMSAGAAGVNGVTAIVTVHAEQPI
jgi:hypothetical protein